MAFTTVLVKVEHGKEVARVGEYGFHSRPERGDLVRLVGAGTIEEYEVLGYRFYGFDVDSTEQMPRTLNPEREAPTMLVKFLDVSFDPPA